MSKSWAKGSDSAWRGVRAAVLERDDYRCRLKRSGCEGLANTVHHTLGRARTGDDPRYLVSACAHCNYSLGDPGQSTEIKRLTNWG